MATEKNTTPLTKLRGRWVARPRVSATYRPQVDVGPATMTVARAQATYDAMVEQGLLTRMLEQHEAKKRGKVETPERERTVRYVAKLWTSGEMLRTHGKVNGLRAKASSKTDVGRFESHVLGHIGDRDVASITPEDVSTILAKMPAKLSSGTRRQVLALLSMFFRLCEYPMRLRPENSNPVRKWMVPAKDDQRLTSYLYPSEFAALASCDAVPLSRRVYYAFATYTGLRKGSLLSITWRDIDFANGVIVVLKNKTGRPQAFSLDVGLCELLLRWQRHTGGQPADTVMATLELVADMEASVFRGDLRTAGVTRDVLHRDDPAVQPIRFHDLRATFATWAKRDNRTDGWIQDRTGHVTKEMLDHYTRSATSLADIKQKPFPDLLPLFADLGRSMDAEATALSPVPDESSTILGCRTGNAPVEDGVTFQDDRAHGGDSSKVHDTQAESPQKSGELTTRHDVSDGGASMPPSIESALAMALTEATRAGRWDVVSQLAAELQARRLEGSNVVALPAKRSGGRG